jgi:hypothetical protein
MTLVARLFARTGIPPSFRVFFFDVVEPSMAQAHEGVYPSLLPASYLCATLV